MLTKKRRRKKKNEAQDVSVKRVFGEVLGVKCKFMVI